jgi:hypothetical protein
MSFKNWALKQKAGKNSIRTVFSYLESAEGPQSGIRAIRRFLHADPAAVRAVDAAWGRYKTETKTAKITKTATK